jgi:Calcineurin-like phosphoesterase
MNGINLRETTTFMRIRHGVTAQGALLAAAICLHAALAVADAANRTPVSAVRSAQARGVDGAGDAVFCDGMEAIAGCATPTPPPPFTFLAYGDSRAGTVCDGNAIHLSLVARMATEASGFVFHLGDMVAGYDATTNWTQRGLCPDDASRGSLQEIIAPLRNRTPPPGVPLAFIPVVGNHDDNWNDHWYPDGFGNGFCNLFDPHALVVNHTQQPYFSHNQSVQYADAQFYALACSTTSSAVYPTYLYYSFDYRNTHFVVMRLNGDYDDLEACNTCGADRSNYDDYYRIHQLDWLRADLAAASARPSISHVLVFLHAPLFTTADGHFANVSWPRLSKLFSQYGVKMVFSGHNHVYERTYPVFASDANPDGVRDDLNGTVYTVSGGGGSALSGFRASTPLTAMRSSEHHYLRVTVSGSQISVTAVRPDGSIIDSYTH